MERKIGEIFTYNGKTYQAVKGSECENCDVRWHCISASSIAGTCFRGYRSDNTNIIFKEINNMENNQLTINIPEGMEIDLENSDLTKGIVKFKQSTITYEDVKDTLVLCMHSKDIIVNESNASKLVNLSKLMNIARYYNRNWNPNWNTKESKYYIYYRSSEDEYVVGSTVNINWDNIYFKSRDDAKSVIDNPNFRDILDAIYKD